MLTQPRVGSPTGTGQRPAPWSTRGWPWGALLSLGIGVGIAFAPVTSDPLVWLAFLSGFTALLVASRSAGRTALLSPATVFAALYVALTHVGALIYYVQRPDQNANFLRMSSFALLAFSAGVYLAGIGSRPHLRTQARALGPPQNDVVSHRKVIWVAFGILGSIAALFVLWDGSRRAGGIPILGLLTGDTPASVRLYAQTRADFARVPGQGYMFNLYAVVLPVSALALAMRAAQTGLRRGRLGLVAMAVLSVATAAAGGYRGQLAVLAVMVIVALSYYHGSAWTATTRRVAVTTIVAVGFMSAMTYQSTASSGSVTDVLLLRVFQVQALGAQYVYSTIPASGPFSGGSELLDDLGGVLPGRQQGYSSQLPKLRGVRSLNNPIGVPAELYLNFGPTGMVLGMFVLGGLCHWVHSRLLSSRTIGNVALGAGLATALGYGAVSGLVGMLFQYGVVTVLVMGSVLAVLDLSRRPARNQPVNGVVQVSHGT